MDEQVEVVREVGAPADRVWALVADVTRMGEWSPENEGATWLKGATGPEPGAAFRGVNRNGRRTWRTVGRIIDADSGRLLSFRVSAFGLPISEWRYAFEPTETGCRVTETWIDRRGALMGMVGRRVTGSEHDAAQSRDGMEKTLEDLKLAAESAAASGA